jgi:methyl-accepting chemotaxis protein
MFAGARVVVVFLGIVLCALFGVATFVGGWIAFGIAACLALLCMGGACVYLSRIDCARLEMVDDLEMGLVPEGVANDELGGALARLGQTITSTSEERILFMGALNGLGNPAYLSDVNGRIIMATKAVLEILNKPANQVVGYSVSQALYNLDKVTLSDKVLSSRQAVDDIVELSLWDGRVVPVRLFANLVYDPEGEVVGVITSFVDLSEDVEKQRKIEDQGANMLKVGEHLSGLAEHVASATELLSAAADDQAQGAQKQKNQTTAVAASMEQMTATVLEVARNATATSDAADQARESADEGVSMVNKAVDAINEVAESTDLLGQEIGQLDVQAAEIGRIINVINDIADQTNLLALNAAIEAARAGDAGRGFAVVADEVRKLAEKTVAATKEVEEAISTIQQRSGTAIKSMRQTEEQVGASTKLSNQAGKALQQIMENISDMVTRVSQIATAAEEQSSAAEEINHSIDEIAEIATEADEAAGQAASATRDLAGLAQELLNVSKNFMEGGGENKLRESEGEMKGILLKLTQEFVKQQYGGDVFEGMQEEMGNPVFLPTDSYPDQAFMQMAELVGAQAGISTREFFLGFGRYSVVKFHEMYPLHFKDESLKSFYLRMNDIHAQLTKDQPGINPPNFTYEDKGDDLFMNYRSSRGLFDYYEGILLGAADFKGEKVSIEVKPFDETSARAEIVFHGKA